MPKETYMNLPADKRRLIFDVAVEEFAAHDYRNASVTNIAARAGVAKGSIYQYFEDKRDLYLYLLQMAREEKQAFLGKHPPPDPQMSLFDFLHWLMRAGASFELTNPRLAKVVYRALFSDRPFGDEPFEEIRRATVGYYHNLVAMGLAQGVIDPKLDRGLVVFLLSSVFNEFGRFLIEREAIDIQELITGKVQYEDAPIELFAGQLIEILRRGLAPICDGA
jgi:AcrR family transcriptional regulator